MKMKNKMNKKKIANPHDTYEFKLFIAFVGFALTKVNINEWHVCELNWIECWWLVRQISPQTYITFFFFFTKKKGNKTHKSENYCFQFIKFYSIYVFFFVVIPFQINQLYDGGDGFA